MGFYYPFDLKLITNYQFKKSQWELAVSGYHLFYFYSFKTLSCYWY